MTHTFSGNSMALESSERKKILPVDDILKKINIKHGDTVIDFGCGVGYFTLPILELIGDNGLIVAIDTSLSMLDEIKKRVGDKNNLKLIQAQNLNDLDIKADLILIITVLHEVTAPSELLTSCFNRLKEGGRVIVIDWQKKNSNYGPPMEHRIAKEEVLNMANKNRVEKEINDNSYFNDNFYFIEFTN